jgi:hypothetical protein
MDSGNESASRAVVSVRTMDIVVAVILVAIGALVMWDSYRVGAAWAVDGPQSGYFPFRVGLLIVLSALATLALSLFRGRGRNAAFVHRHQLKLVLQVLVPTIVFAVAIPFLGIYVAMAIFIAWFMWRQGKFGPTKIAPVAILVPIALFLMFEIWFLVPLPKGPLETALGY